MPALTEPQTCHITGCDRPATHACDRCGQPHCDGHLQPVSLERRTDPSATQRGRWDLTRAQSRIEIYRLCALCSKKPFSGRSLPDAAS
jgi:hypothetical protein